MTMNGAPETRNWTPWIRLGAFVFTIATGIVLVRYTSFGDLLTEEGLVALTTGLRERWWSPLVLIGLFALVSIVGLPPAPLLLGGAVFGFVAGTVYNLVGLTVGAFAAYAVALLLGRDAILRLTGPRLRKAERVLARHGFWPLVQARCLPIPFAFTNFGAALAGVPLPRFSVSTMLGLIPSTVVHTFFLARLIEKDGARAQTTGLYLAAFGVLNLVLSSLWVRERRQRGARLRELRRIRASRASGD